MADLVENHGDLAEIHGLSRSLGSRPLRRPDSSPRPGADVASKARSIPPEGPLGSRVALTFAVSLLAACGPGGPGGEPAAERDAGLFDESLSWLSAGPEALEEQPAEARAGIFEQLLQRSRGQAGSSALAGPAVFLVEREGRLVASALPEAEELLSGGAGEVELDRFSDSWPDDARQALGGESERALAGRLAASLAGAAGLTGRFPAVRDPEAPYAAAVVEGQVRLNPALLYLAAAPRECTAGHAAEAAEEKALPASSCSAGPGGPVPALALAALAAARARRRSYSKTRIG